MKKVILWVLLVFMGPTPLIYHTIQIPTSLLKGRLVLRSGLKDHYLNKHRFSNKIQNEIPWITKIYEYFKPKYS